jgi:hypothetical protein
LRLRRAGRASHGPLNADVRQHDGDNVAGICISAWNHRATIRFRQEAAKLLLCGCHCCGCLLHPDRSRQIADYRCARARFCFRHGHIHMAGSSHSRAMQRSGTHNRNDQSILTPDSLLGVHCGDDGVGFDSTYTRRLLYQRTRRTSSCCLTMRWSGP